MTTAIRPAPNTVEAVKAVAALAAAADLLAADEWDPYLNPLVSFIDRAAGFTPGSFDPDSDAEAVTLAAWDLLCLHLRCEWAIDWERQVGRTQRQVEAALRAAAGQGAVS